MLHCLCRFQVAMSTGRMLISDAWKSAHFTEMYHSANASMLKKGSHLLYICWIRSLLEGCYLMTNVYFAFYTLLSCKNHNLRFALLCTSRKLFTLSEILKERGFMGTTMLPQIGNFLRVSVWYSPYVNR